MPIAYGVATLRRSDDKISNIQITETKQEAEEIRDRENLKLRQIGTISFDLVAVSIQVLKLPES